MKSGNLKYIANRLWHEVAHLYFRDVWKPWDLSYEFRADLVASAATGRDITIRRLHEIKATASSKDSFLLLDKRIENLKDAPDSYSKADALNMLRCLQPVTVLNSVRGNQYI